MSPPHPTASEQSPPPSATHVVSLQITGWSRTTGDPLHQHRPLGPSQVYETECATDEILFSTLLVFIRNVETTKITSRHVAGVLLVII